MDRDKSGGLTPVFLSVPGAYGVVQAFGPEKDDTQEVANRAYQKVAQATSAGSALAARASLSPPPTLTVPMVVVACPMLGIALVEDDLHIEEREAAAIFVEHDSWRGTCLIVREQQLRRVAEQLIVRMRVISGGGWQMNS